MITKEQLFYNTGFPEKLQNAIYKDINNLISFYPELKPINYPSSPKHLVLIQGTVPITFQSADFDMPINIQIPSDFPKSEPIAQIWGKVTPSQALRADGHINTNIIIKWIPLKTQLPHFVDSIAQFFSRIAPYTPEVAATMKKSVPSSINQAQQQRIPTYGYQQPAPSFGGYQQQYRQYSQPANSPVFAQQQVLPFAINEAGQEIARLQAELKQIEERRITVRMFNSAIPIVHSVTDGVIVENQQLEAQIQAMQNQGIPDYPIDPSIAMRVDGQAATEAHNALIEAMRVAIRRGSAPLEEITDCIRTESIQYFNAAVFQELRQHAH